MAKSIAVACRSNQHNSWYELGEGVGLDVISDEDEEFEEYEDDKEVASLFNQSKEVQKKLLKGTILSIQLKNTCTRY